MEIKTIGAEILTEIIKTGDVPSELGSHLLIDTDNKRINLTNLKCNQTITVFNTYKNYGLYFHSFEGKYIKIQDSKIEIQTDSYCKIHTIWSRAKEIRCSGDIQSINCIPLENTEIIEINTINTKSIHIHNDYNLESFKIVNENTFKSSNSKNLIIILGSGENINISGISCKTISINRQRSESSIGLSQIKNIEYLELIDITNKKDSQGIRIDKIRRNKKTKNTLILDNIYGKILIEEINTNRVDDITISQAHLESHEDSRIKEQLPLNINNKNKKDKYDFFNHLYTIAKKSNNRDDINHYYQATQESLLQLKKNNWHKNIPSIISLQISKIRSSFGINRIQGITITLLLTLNLYILFLLSINGNQGEISKFRLFLNPVHKLSERYNGDGGHTLNGLSYFLDLLGRICASIGIYETIRSFRKYHRQ